MQSPNTVDKSVQVLLGTCMHKKLFCKKCSLWKSISYEFWNI